MYYLTLRIGETEMLYSCAIDILSTKPCPSVQWFDSQQQNGYISSAKSLIEEIKTFCFSSTFKVEEDKVSLFLQSEAYQRWYSHFVAGNQTIVYCTEGHGWIDKMSIAQS